MSKERILIIGASSLGKLTIDIIERQDKFDVVGFIDTTLDLGTEICGVKVIGREDHLPDIMKRYNVDNGIIALGHNYNRFLQAKRIKNIAPGFGYVSVIHPSAVLGSRTKIGNGCIIAAGVVINNDTEIGDFCYLALNAGISHDSKMGSYSSLGPGATTGGNVKIGEFTAIGVGANILNDRIIGDHSVVGSACLVYRNVADRKVVYGVPAREIRNRQPSDPYL